MSRGCAAKKSLHASERDTPRLHELRRRHVECVAGRTDLHRFYFLDETGLRLDYTRRYARARGGRRVGGAVPLQRGRALTLIGALGVRGLTAVQLLDGALNQRSFAFYIGRVLGPQLRRGDVLVLDNLPVHQFGGLQQELARRGVEVLFLPPYSPDFTPIEQAWSKLKTNLRPSPGPHPRSPRGRAANGCRLDFQPGRQSVVQPLRLPCTPFLNPL